MIWAWSLRHLHACHLNGPAVSFGEELSTARCANPWQAAPALAPNPQGISLVITVQSHVIAQRTGGMAQQKASPRSTSSPLIGQQAEGSSWSSLRLFGVAGCRGEKRQESSSLISRPQPVKYHVLHLSQPSPMTRLSCFKS